MDKELQELLERYKAKIIAETEKKYKDKAETIIADIMANASVKRDYEKARTQMATNAGKIRLLQDLGFIDIFRASELMIKLTEFNIQD